MRGDYIDKSVVRRWDPSRIFFFESMSNVNSNLSLVPYVSRVCGQCQCQLLTRYVGLAIITKFMMIKNREGTRWTAGRRRKVECISWWKCIRDFKLLMWCIIMMTWHRHSHAMCVNGMQFFTAQEIVSCFDFFVHFYKKWVCSIFLCFYFP